ncbi:glycosyltransferase family 4 protein [Rhodopirellula sp. SWK7]|uniref:glycosyltransferase family 4 protein n=1 Tax=Rhodopirellula sp. SWK7 TaxID=595460 RepID=UPI0002BDA650|nr:glycosyltransferase family 1 protein [Rhodopirellula sp. SWK7]EMI41665.1 Glycosyl transferase, group 1 [Rhodopirellula sp. SWK7]
MPLRISAYTFPNGTVSPTGVAKHEIEMLFALKNLGHNVEILAGHDQFASDGKVTTGSPLRSLPASRIPVPARILHNVWRSFSLPVADRWCDNPDWIYTSLEQFIPSNKHPVASTIHCIHWLEPSLPWFRERQTAKLRSKFRHRFAKIATRSDKILTVSEFLKNRITHHFKVAQDRLFVVGNGAEQEYFNLGDQRSSEKFPFDQNAPYLINIAGLDHKKGADLLLRFSDELQARRSPMKLHILGAMRGEKRFIESARQRENIRLHEYLPKNLLLPFLASATALVMFSRYETFGIPAVEAMAAGVPVVASEYGALPEVIADGGRIVKPSTPQGFADEVEDLLTNTIAREHTISLGRKRATEFTWQSCASRLERALQS